MRDLAVKIIRRQPLADDEKHQVNTLQFSIELFANNDGSFSYAVNVERRPAIVSLKKYADTTLAHIDAGKMLHAFRNGIANGHYVA